MTMYYRNPIPMPPPPRLRNNYLCIRDHSLMVIYYKCSILWIPRIH